MLPGPSLHSGSTIQLIPYRSYGGGWTGEDQKSAVEMEVNQLQKYPGMNFSDKLNLLSKALFI